MSNIIAIPSDLIYGKTDNLKCLVRYAVAFGVFEKSDFPGESRRIKSVVCHPEFKATYQQIQNDICLIRLSEPVTFNSRIKPVCVATEAPEGTLL